MRKIQYGSKTIAYDFLKKEGLRTHYITVERNAGVILKGKRVSDEIADKLILKKARWILNKLEALASSKEEQIVTGSRLPYLGKSYYVQIKIDKRATTPMVVFNYSKFFITVNDFGVSQNEIQGAIQEFYKSKAVEKIAPRVQKLSNKTSLFYKELQFRKMGKRWGSCTGKNRIIINPEAVKLSFELIDYLIIHELVHTKVKDHSKAFWRLLSRHVYNWKTLDERIKTKRF